MPPFSKILCRTAAFYDYREKGKTMIDLHLHSDASDGTKKPLEVLREAKKKGLYAIALTDHDTVAGIPEILESGEL